MIRPVLLGLLLGSVVLSACAGPRTCGGQARQVSQAGKRYQWINPLLDCDAELAFQEIKPFKGKLRAYIDSQQGKGAPTHVSVYYRDLNNGPWLGIGEQEEFVPASLLKLPLLFGVLRLAEAEPGLLQRPLLFPADLQVPDEKRFAPSSPLVRGRSYQIEELAERMVHGSDNYAAMILMNTFGTKLVGEVYADLGVPVPEDGVPSLMQVKHYAALFRILYNASYLDRRTSEKVLGWLADSAFRDGLVAGVPRDVRVAHKYGERDITGTDNVQLHDCGIVYYPGHPYLLCVMTRGPDYSSMARVIAGISRLVYHEVDAQAARR